MICSNCKKEISETSKFCRYCGHTLLGRTQYENYIKDSARSVESNITDRKDLIDLQKNYTDTGNSSIALSILGFIISFLLSIGNYSLEDSLLGTLIITPLLAPFFYFGKKLKDDGVGNLKYARKVSGGMFIYTIVFVIINVIAGGVGWLWLLLLYYYYKSYKETTKHLVSGL